MLKQGKLHFVNCVRTYLRLILMEVYAKKEVSDPARMEISNSMKNQQRYISFSYRRILPNKQEEITFYLTARQGSFQKMPVPRGLPSVGEETGLEKQGEL